MESSFRLGKLAGIEVGVHYTWLLALALVTWSLATGMFPSDYPRWDQRTYWLVAVVAALLLFFCVLLHELSHSVVARARGMSVAGITLFIFGGVSNIRGEAEEPGDEFWMAVVGPLTSLALAAVAWLLWQALGAGNSPVAAVLRYLAYVNLLLAIFNLIPGFPLDGGRVLRSLIWALTGNLRWATRFAARLGQGIAYLFILGGILFAIQGAILNGVWLVLIGYFLLTAAESTGRQFDAAAPGRAKVVDLLGAPPPTVPSTLTVDDLFRNHLLAQGRRAALVADADRIVGLVSLADVHRLPAERWATTPISAVMTPAARLVAIGPETSIRDALTNLAEHDVNQLPVIQDGRLVGLLSRADVIGYLRRREAPTGGRGEASAARPPVGPDRAGPA